MNERILNILLMCLQAKEKGHDCFFDYVPHVDKIQVRIFLNGWKRDTVPSYDLETYTDYLSMELPQDTTIDDIEKVLKELIGSDANGPGQL